MTRFGIEIGLQKLGGGKIQSRPLVIDEEM